MSVIARFRNRKQLSAEVTVKFLPSSLYQNYATTLGLKTAGELTEEQRLEAEQKLLELTFKLSRPSPVEVQKWERESIASASQRVPTQDYIDYIKLKLGDHFRGAEHRPPEGVEKITLAQKDFREFLDYLSLIELIELGSAYMQALREDERQAEGNGHTSGQVG